MTSDNNAALRLVPDQIFQASGQLTLLGFGTGIAGSMSNPHGQAEFIVCTHLLAAWQGQENDLGPDMEIKYMTTLESAEQMARDLLETIEIAKTHNRG